MLYDNFAMLTKRELLIRIVKLLKKDELITGLKYLPVEMRPRNKRPVLHPQRPLHPQTQDYLDSGL